MKYIACLALAVSLISCGAPSAEQEENLKRTQSQLVARIEVAAGHAIEFYEFQPGVVAIYEHGSIDSGDKPLFQESWAHLSLTELHQQLVPGKPVPESLRQAEQRQRAYKESLATPSPEALAMPRQDVTPVQPPLRPPPALHIREEPPHPAPEPLGMTEAVAHAPGGKQPGDGEVTQLDAASDAAWWQSNFCMWADMVDGVWCPTNVTMAHSGWRPTMYYEAAGMSASSTASATFWVEQYTNGWVNVFTANAGPRTWWKWGMNGEGWFRSGVEGLQPQPLVHFAERYRTAATTFSSSTQWFPSDHEWNISNDIQGMTHDSGNWYFTRAEYGLDSEADYGEIAKMPVGSSLSNNFPLVYRQPSAMINAGFHHFGDLTFRGDRLYVAMEGGGRCALGVWYQDIAYYQAWGVVPELSGCGWVAYNPRDGLFYFNDGGSTLRRYSVTVSGSTLSAVEVLPRVTLSTNVTNWQGAEFSNRGVLYIATGYKQNPMSVHAIDITSGYVYWRASWTTSDPGDWEAEGLTLWDLTSGQAPGVNGHLHVQLLDNDFWDSDNVWLGHLTADDPSRL